ncbi:MAG TPA: dihydrodipicolinate synthase family protein [Thermoplasmata archaeon]|nr:dihydrodipicolinate synthase family protein [Thermoplasmata archaeon]
MALAGLAVPTPTLFDIEGAFDEDRNRRYHAGLVAAGVDHLFPLGSLGEFPSVEEEERDRLLDIVQGTLRGATDLWVGVGAPSTRCAVRWAQHARDREAAALLAVPPYYLRPTAAAIADYYRAIARATGIPLLAYNIPAKVGYALTPELVHALAREGTLVGIKDTSGSLESVRGFLQGAPAGFAVLPGDDVLAGASIAAGATGAVMGLANIAPNLGKALVRAALDGRADEVARHQAVVESLAHVVAQGPFPSTGKYLARHLRGAPDGYRAPYGPLTDDEERAVIVGLTPVRAVLDPYLQEG